MEGTRFRFSLIPAAVPLHLVGFAWEIPDGHPPHVDPWPKEAVSNEEAIESSRACHMDASPQRGYGHVCSTCETVAEGRRPSGKTPVTRTAMSPLVTL